MSIHKRKVLHKRDGYLPLSGTVIESDPTPTASTLMQNTAAPTNLNPPPSDIPATISNASSASTSQSTSPAAGTGSVTSSGEQISLGTVVGACVAALVALLFSVLLAFYCSKRHKKATAYAKSRNAMSNASRRRSHLEAWKRMDDSGVREGQERPVKQLPSPGPLVAMFHRTSSNTSGGKSSDGNNRESIGTMQHFVKYHPGLAAEMASQGTTTDVDGQVAKPQPVLRLAGRTTDMTPPISLDGDTIGGDSFFSLHSNLSNSVSPVMMVTERSTPPAMMSTMHRWESAEVLHADDPIGLDIEPQNPFSDKASSVKSSIKGSVKSSLKGQNPFFSAQDHLIKRTLPPCPHENPFSDTNTPRDSSDAIRSLIAALEVPPSDNERIVSLQSSLYSRMTGDDGESAISVTAFPYPPTKVTIR